MGKIVEKRKKKKKGRPSLLDLQKRSIKQHLHQIQTQKPNLSISNSNNSPLPSSPNYKSATHPSLRRSTRRNPSPSSPQTHPHDEDDDSAAVQLNGWRREKKLKLVLKLPSSQNLDPNSPSLKSNASDSDGHGDEHSASYDRKRKINAITDGSELGVSDKGEKSVSGANPSNNEQDLGPSTPLPDKKLLLFILDRLQKKDTYGVFSEPVDPNELPDYHEVIADPMDFGTVRNKLSSGIYTSLEQFEKDVFLICSNAMQYNAPDTVYFRQARSIQELAKKNFENLRQDSDDNEPEAKVVRRGRPPTKNFKKPLGRPLLDRAGSEFSLDATLSPGGQSSLPSNNDLRKGSVVPDKSGFADLSVRSHGSGNDAYWLADNKFERNDEATGSIFKGYSINNGKRQFVLDENRRNTYKRLLAGGREPSVLATFDAERKQLMAVGLLSEYGYARSLAQFTANIGSVAWKIASARIERSLPPGIKFGHGWVGENDIPPQRALLLSSSPSVQLSSSKPLSLPENSRAPATSSIVEPKEEMSEIPENYIEGGMHTIQSAAKGQLSNALSLSASTSTSPAAANKSEPRPESAEEVEGLNSQGGYNMQNTTTSPIRPRPPLQIHQSRAVHPVMNGLNGTFGVHLPAQMGKLVGAARPAGLNFQSSQINRVSRTTTGVVDPAAVNSFNSKNLKISDNSSDVPPNSGNEEMKLERPVFEPQPSRQPQPKLDSGLSPQQKPDSVPPDLNMRFQSPSSPNSNRVDSAQPDLALQL